MERHSPPVAAAALDCRACGACCVPQITSPFYVRVLRADLARLEPRWRDRNVARGSLLTRLDPAGNCVCVALRGTVGRRVFCGIHPRRPDACRELLAGSDECRLARAEAGLDG